MNHNLTLHIVNSIPWSNLNRDDTGTPKRLNLGGVLRGQLSSQSIKRAVRCDYEEKSGDISKRSAHLVELVVERARELAPELDEKAALRDAKKIIGTLTKDLDKAAPKDGEAPAEKGRSAWLSDEELNTAAQNLANNANAEMVQAGKTGSLAIAAFGRMFANAPEKGTEAALSVSPAVSTHAALIETDYFTTTDDSPSADQGAGATFLGIAMFTSGVFYRTVTIDRKQLRESWTGFDREAAREQLEALVTALIYKLPRGKQHATAPYVMPLAVLVEEQAYRLAYDFETPVRAATDGGYAAATIDRLREQRKAALAFDPDAFGPVAAVGGTVAGLDDFDCPQATKQELVAAVVDWILE